MNQVVIRDRFFTSVFVYEMIISFGRFVGLKHSFCALIHMIILLPRRNLSVERVQNATEGQARVRRIRTNGTDGRTHDWYSF